VNVLIVGGTGLISQALTRQLQERGVEVTHYNRGQKQPAVAPLRPPRTLTGDRYVHAAFEAQVQEAGRFDAVIDMIGYAPTDSESLVRAVRGRTSHVIFCSTIDVHQKPATKYPITEAEPRRGNNTYGRNKVICEDVMMEAQRRGDFAVTVIRPGHTYGEGRGVFGCLGDRGHIDRLRRGKPVVVHGDGTSLWTSCHIEDVARAFVGALENPKAHGKAYNVPGEEWFTWNHWTEVVARLLGAPPPQLVHIPSALLHRAAPKRGALCVENFFGHNIYDTAAARADLGFRYTINLEEGMRRVLAWWLEQGKVSSSDDDAFTERLLAAWERLSGELVRDVAGLDT
jgi:nucleoside-diphosphate-sugar epimerase